MPDSENKLEWHLSGRQDFKIRMAREIQLKYPGSVVSSATARLEKRTSNKPPKWTDVSKPASILNIIADDFDPDNLVLLNALYLIADADTDGDPVAGEEYRWHCIARLDNGLDVVAKPEVELIP